MKYVFQPLIFWDYVGFREGNRFFPTTIQKPRCFCEQNALQHQEVFPQQPPCKTLVPKKHPFQLRLLSKASFLLFSPHLGFFFQTDLFKDSLVVDLIFPASHWTFVGVTTFSLGFPNRSHAAGD